MLMESSVEKLKHIGLTEYEAKAYLALLNTHLSTATQTAEKSGVPRTKIYSVLESLCGKGWVRIYSGVPLLFKALEPVSVFEKVKEDYAQLLESIQMTLKDEVDSVKEKFVIKRFDVGLEGLKSELAKAKTIEINNATTSFLKKVNDSISKDAVVRVLLFPGETKIFGLPHSEFKEAEVSIVTIIRNKEVPSMSITLDEERTFTVFQDPVDNKFIVDEMLYDECQRCFASWSNMSWNSESP
jgi:sugar-specific transcriptional regulator TrmB